MEWGRRFAGAGLLHGVADVFLLSVEELRETATMVDRRALVAEHRTEMERFRTIVPPSSLGAAPDAARASVVPASAEPAIWHRATAGSPGVARGTARLVRCIQDAERVGSGDTLVAETTSSSWTPLFATVAAVVTGTGGMLSHSAIVAREYRVPAVVGLGPALAGIRNGQRLEVDGSRGTVRA